MLEYSKIILDKMSFDPCLFEKEFKKLRRWLLKKERAEFERWSHSKFYSVYPDVVSRLIKN